jgi:histone-binding protein RBBP4
VGGSEDMSVCVWDVNGYTKGNSKMDPLTTFSGHTSVVGDVDFHHTNENVLASVGDDKMLIV